MSFNGVNVFKENQGGGVTLFQTELDVSDTALFEGNMAHNGGAIELIEQSFVSGFLHPNVYQDLSTFSLDCAKYRC